MEGAIVCENRKDRAVGVAPPYGLALWERWHAKRDGEGLYSRHFGGHYAPLLIGRAISFTRPRADGVPCAGRKVRLRFRFAQGDTIGRGICSRHFGGHYAPLPIGRAICFTRPRAVGAPCAGRKVRLRFRSAQGDTIGRCIGLRVFGGRQPAPYEGGRG